MGASVGLDGEALDVEVLSIRGDETEIAEIKMPVYVIDGAALEESFQLTCYFQVFAWTVDVKGCGVEVGQGKVHLDVFVRRGEVSYGCEVEIDRRVEGDDIELRARVVVRAFEGYVFEKVAVPLGSGYARRPVGSERPRRGNPLALDRERDCPEAGIGYYLAGGDVGEVNRSVKGD